MAPTTYRAPGRVNLIGEHTDYNDGWVMPAAIQLEARITVTPRPDGLIRMRSTAYPDEAVFAPDGDPTVLPLWARVLAREAALLQSAGVPLRGAELEITSDVPIGSGLSSSAAVQVGVGYALAATAAVAFDLDRLALLCQQASHDIGGARCGIMDLYIACHGRAGQLVQLDTRTLETRWHPWAENLRLVACDTGVRHDNASGEYNQRRAECEEAVRRLAQVIPGVRSLRDLNLRQLQQHAAVLDPTLLARSRHVVSENARVEAAAAALDAGDIPRLAQLLNQSHFSLQNDYAVSCPELDLMAQLCRAFPGVHGARMMGGGFGGCVLALAEPQAVEPLGRMLARDYTGATGKPTRIWSCRPSAGVGPVAASAPSAPRDKAGSRAPQVETR